MIPTIPSHLKIEHKIMRGSIFTLTKEDGDIGSIAREALTVLDAHLIREEVYVFPLLDLLGPLSRGESVSHSTGGLLVMCDAFARELPHMTNEHSQIARAAESLAHAAKAMGKNAIAHTADLLKNHMLIEDAILYPAALLIGQNIRLKQGA